jgi:hypothetical protein
MLTRLATTLLKSLECYLFETMQVLSCLDDADFALLRRGAPSPAPRRHCTAAAAIRQPILTPTFYDNSPLLCPSSSCECLLFLQVFALRPCLVKVPQVGSR